MEKIKSHYLWELTSVNRCLNTKAMYTEATRAHKDKQGHEPISNHWLHHSLLRSFHVADTASVFLSESVKAELSFLPLSRFSLLVRFCNSVSLEHLSDVDSLRLPPSPFVELTAGSVDASDVGTVASGVTFPFSTGTQLVDPATGSIVSLDVPEGTDPLAEPASGVADSSAFLAGDNPGAFKSFLLELIGSSLS